jgi:hypothetical protein
MRQPRKEHELELGVDRLPTICLSYLYVGVCGVYVEIIKERGMAHGLRVKGGFDKSRYVDLNGVRKTVLKAASIWEMEKGRKRISNPVVVLE